MAVINRIAAFADDIAAWRRDFHENPELLYDVHRTAAIVAQKLREFGCDEVVTGLGRTGVVGVIKGNQQTSGRIIGLRADMDALPIAEATGLPYASKSPGKMHACGHDGHTAMLLGAAKYLAETRNFNGIAIVIFQPAEEGGAGGEAMVKDGLMERFGIQEVYGLHNMPGLDVGHFAIKDGPVMAAADRFDIEIEGRGGHAAMPHLCIDPVTVGMQIGLALQTIVARNVDPIDSAVLSITAFNTAEAYNVLPQNAKLIGTVRTFKPDVQDLIERRMQELVQGVAAAMGAKARLTYRRGYPVTFNHPRQTALAAEAARAVVGEAKVDSNVAPVMGAEDFAYMLQARPGAYIFLGNGDSPACHHPAYDFNDSAIPHGASFWARLVETVMAAQ